MLCGFFAFEEPRGLHRVVVAVAVAARRAVYSDFELSAISTGLGASELRGLRWKDVDLKHGELHV